MIKISIEKSASKYSKEHVHFSVAYIDAGHHSSDTDWAHKKRFLDHYEIIFVVKGTLHLQVNDRQYCLSDTDVIVLPQFVTISSYMSSENPLSFYWIKFHSKNFNEFQIRNHYFNIHHSFDLIRLFQGLMLMSNTNSSLEYAKDIALTHLLCFLAANCNRRAQRTGLNIGAILQWIDDNLSADLSVATISHAFNYNKDYLCRVFKAETGTTMKEYINAKQLKRAKDLLITSEYSIRKISEILKYENTNLFIKFFTYHERISPNKFRNMGKH